MKLSLVELTECRPDYHPVFFYAHTREGEGPPTGPGLPPLVIAPGELNRIESHRCA